MKPQSNLLICVKNALNSPTNENEKFFRLASARHEENEPARGEKGRGQGRRLKEILKSESIRKGRGWGKRQGHGRIKLVTFFYKR
jgi:hypothetical protein